MQLTVNRQGLHALAVLTLTGGAPGVSYRGTLVRLEMDQLGGGADSPTDVWGAMAQLKPMLTRPLSSLSNVAATHEIEVELRQLDCLMAALVDCHGGALECLRTGDAGDMGVVVEALVALTMTLVWARVGHLRETGELNDQ